MGAAAGATSRARVGTPATLALSLSDRELPMAAAAADVDGVVAGEGRLETAAFLPAAGAAGAASSSSSSSLSSSSSSSSSSSDSSAAAAAAAGAGAASSCEGKKKKRRAKESAWG